MQNAVRAYISLGSNAPQAEVVLGRACHCLERLPDMRLAVVSPVYHTEPQEYRQQPWFLNQVAELLPGRGWEPAKLMYALFEVEQRLGRVRSTSAERFGPRVIDADLLLYGAERSTCAECTLPHPRMTRRAFVLIPLLGIAPDIRINGVRATDLLELLDYRLEGKKIFQ
ncbi:MAG: 2-amino-4-hydroxy-6-hydroxymethyldihydropteridine diphosphokinase [Desulfovibrio sp.]|jgi:2-amino-4-hydroxy-6-hydroxymethyldihydropteridine diphosphokinase|nr:2-amino-4-hydroxy-6-hydroxymethyldihydropteridine diphosphokinase [Desulfovibrio sp.]